MDQVGLGLDWVWVGYGSKIIQPEQYGLGHGFNLNPIQPNPRTPLVAKADSLGEDGRERVSQQGHQWEIKLELWLRNSLTDLHCGHDTTIGVRT